MHELCVAVIDHVKDVVGGGQHADVAWVVDEPVQCAIDVRRHASRPPPRRAAPERRTDGRRVDNPGMIARQARHQLSATRSMLGQPSSRNRRTRHAHASGHATELASGIALDELPEKRRVLARHDGPVVDRNGARRPRAERSSRSEGSANSRWMARVQAAASRSATMRPASPTTYGISPLSDAMTGTPHANASISIRPNCSRHRGS